jgi:type VI secretion system protein VasD
LNWTIPLWQLAGPLLAPAPIAALLLVALSGCAHLGGACETPPPAFIGLQASDRLNPDARGRSLPTVVRVLQLKAAAKFNTAELTDLWSRADEVLGPELLHTDELTVDPGKSARKWVERHPETAYVAVVALFRQPVGANWKRLVSLSPPSRCAKTPAGTLEAPGGDDAQLWFVLEDFRVVPKHG